MIKCGLSNSRPVTMCPGNAKDTSNHGYEKNRERKKIEMYIETRWYL